MMHWERENGNILPYIEQTLGQDCSGTVFISYCHIVVYLIPQVPLYVTHCCGVWVPLWVIHWWVPLWVTHRLWVRRKWEVSSCGGKWESALHCPFSVYIYLWGFGKYLENILKNTFYVLWLQKGSALHCLLGGAVVHVYVFASSSN